MLFVIGPATIAFAIFLGVVLWLVSLRDRPSDPRRTGVKSSLRDGEAYTRAVLAEEAAVVAERRKEEVRHGQPPMRPPCDAPLYEQQAFRREDDAS